MEARKLVVQVAAVCPFAMVLGMGATLRHTTPPHTTLQYSDAQNERIEAYTPLMTRASWASAKPNLVERYADMWITSAKRGNLQALTPAFQEDLDEDNPRSQILQTWSSLLQRLETVLRINLKAHDTNAALRDAARIVGVADVLKFSDFDAFRSSSTCTEKALDLIASQITSGSSDTKRLLRVTIEATQGSRVKLPEMYKLLRSNYDDYVFRRIGVGQQLGDESSRSSDPTGADDSDNETSTQEIQGRYVRAVSLATKLKASEAKAVSLAKS